MSGIDLYYVPPSAPCRSVLAVGKELGINFNLKLVNLMEKEQLKPEYLAINPQHTVPTIVDHDNGDFALWESRAIMTYLVNKSDPNHKLYPTNDIKRRVTIDRWLFFDLGTLYGVIGPPIVYPALMQGLPVDPTKIPPLKEKLAHLDAALSKSKYLASNDNYTLADLSVLSTLSMLDVVDIDYSELTHLTKWYNGLKKELPYYNEVHQAGTDAFKAWAEESKKRAAGK